MLLQAYAYPYNADFLFLGVGVLFVMLGGYVASLVVRFRNTNKEVALLDELDAE